MRRSFRRSAATRIPFLHPVRDLPRPHILDPNETRILSLLKPWSNEPVDVGIVGVPFDGAVLGRPGAKHGPRGVIEALRFNSSYNCELDLDLRVLKVAYLGDVVVSDSDVPESLERIERVLTRIFALGITPVTIGGDHSITFSCVKGLFNASKRRIGVIVFDSHFDVRESIDGRISSGSSFRRLLELEVSPLDGRNLVEIGPHGFLNAKRYAEYLEHKGATVFTSADVRSRGISSVAEEAMGIASRRTDSIYLSVDMDCLDHIYAPGVSAPSPGGLLPEQLFEGIFRIASNERTAAIDIVEIAPTLDVGGMTVRMGATAILHFLAGFLRRSAGEILSKKGR